MRFGLISDTHGRLRNEVFDRFRDVDRILHAGDVGPYDIIRELEAIAPVTAVYGNTDRFDVRDRVPLVARLEAGGLRIAVTHGHQLGSPEPGALRAALPDTDVIVYGHTHRALVDTDGALVVNPGSAGAPRLGRKPSVAVLAVEEGTPRVELLAL
ncbi:MAG: metallophosphoesterase family protein [Gemmatimonadota bacterium]